MTVEDLKEQVAAKLDVAEFLDIIDFTMYELVEALQGELEEHFDELVRACG